MPIVLFYNKRDLGSNQIMPVKYMDTMFSLSSWQVSRLTGSALIGQNVLQAADLISSNLMRQLSESLGAEEDDEQTSKAQEK